MNLGNIKELNNNNNNKDQDTWNVCIKSIKCPHSEGIVYIHPQWIFSHPDPLTAGQENIFEAHFLQMPSFLLNSNPAHALPPRTFESKQENGGKFPIVRSTTTF